MRAGSQRHAVVQRSPASWPGLDKPSIFSLCSPSRKAGDLPASIIPAHGAKRVYRNRRGLTLVELIVAFTILALLTAMSVPMAKYKVRREKEKDLRYALREMRNAIDKYKDMADAGKLGTQKLGSENYPEKLEILVEGVKLAQSAEGAKIRFLRRIPRDPMTNSYEWGMRSLKDDPKSTSWGGENVFDVYTRSMDKASDGTPYSEW